MTLFIRVGGINLDKIEKQKKKFDHLILFSEHCCRDLVLSTKDLACGCVNLEESLHHWIALWFAEISVFKTVVRLGRNFFPFFSIIWKQKIIRYLCWWRCCYTKRERKKQIAKKSTVISHEIMKIVSIFFCLVYSWYSRSQTYHIWQKYWPYW